MEGSLPGREVQTKSGWEGNNHLKKNKKRENPAIGSELSVNKEMVRAT